MAKWARRCAGVSDGRRPVKPPFLPGQHSSCDACLPPEVEQLLLDVVADGFVVYCCGPIAEPFGLVASYWWEDYVDLVVIRCVDRVTAARVPAPRHKLIDVFAPEVAVWTYEGSPQCALRALLNLVHPHHPYAPASPYPAPTSLHIPRAEQRPMTVRLPPPGRAGRRAARLAAAMAAVRSDPIMAGAGCVGTPMTKGA